MDAFEFTKSEAQCPVCGGNPGDPQCDCVLATETGTCEICEAGGVCPCSSSDEQVKLASDIRRASIDTPFKLGL